MKDAKTPSLPEDAKDHPARRLYNDGKHVECTWCKHTFNPDVPFIPGGADDSDAQTIVQGELVPQAASVLMKLLHAARLPGSICSDQSTHWRVMLQNGAKKLVGWVGDPLDQVQVAMYADAASFHFGLSSELAR